MVPGTLRSPKAPPAPSPTQPVVVAREPAVAAGSLRVRNAYDLALYRMPDASYEVVIFMKLQFFFQDGPGGKWTAEERKAFLRD